MFCPKAGATKEGIEDKDFHIGVEKNTIALNCHHGSKAPTGSICHSGCVDISSRKTEHIHCTADLAKASGEMCGTGPVGTATSSQTPWTSTTPTTRTTRMDGEKVMDLPPSPLLPKPVRAPGKDRQGRRQGGQGVTSDGSAKGPGIQDDQGDRRSYNRSKEHGRSTKFMKALRGVGRNGSLCKKVSRRDTNSKEKFIRSNMQRPWRTSSSRSRSTSKSDSSWWRGATCTGCSCHGES